MLRVSHAWAFSAIKHEQNYRIFIIYLVCFNSVTCAFYSCSIKTIMFGTIYKIEPFTITILVRGNCTVKLQKIFLNKVKAPLEIGLKVKYEVEVAKNSKLPKLMEIEEYEFENCGDCGHPHEITCAQYVSIITKYIFKYLCTLCY